MDIVFNFNIYNGSEAHMGEVREELDGLEADIAVEGVQQKTVVDGLVSEINRLEGQVANQEITTAELVSRLKKIRGGVRSIVPDAPAETPTDPPTDPPTEVPVDPETPSEPPTGPGE